jgi:excisionase family DNA binding protein
VDTNEHEQREGLIDIPTAAARLGLGISTLRRKINEGEVPAYRMGGPGTVIRLDPQELDEWLRQPEDNAA